MLFQEKILLSNCDSVKKHPQEEIRKRLLIGLVFGKGVLLSPNILFDNSGILDILQQDNVVKYLNQEGEGEFVIRGRDIEDIKSASDYFEKLEGTYKVSSLGGKEKKDLSPSELKKLNTKLRKLDKIIQDIKPVYQNVPIEPNSLTEEINKRLTPNYFDNNMGYEDFLLNSKHIVSRSDWYNYTATLQDDSRIISIKREIIDPAYNSLFIKSGESFVEDDISLLIDIPEKILSAGVTFKSLRDEIELIQYPLKTFELVTSLGTTELAKIITDKALEYIEDAVSDTGMSYFSRTNWYGLYPKMKKKMGIEIK